MNADELIRTWPSVAKANAETLLASPAWRLTVTHNGSEAFIRKATEKGTDDRLALAVTLDGEENVLGFADTAAFADLHLLWARRRELPTEVLLALVEKECGAFLQTLENSLRMQVSVRGLAERAAGTAFVLQGSDLTVGFSLVATAAVTMAWGRIGNLDAGHASVREMVRQAYVEFAALDLLAAEAATLAPGAALLLPEDVKPAWRVTDSADDLLHVRSVETSEITFAAMADDAWPATPDPAGRAVRIVKAGRTLAEGRIERLGLQTAVRIA